MIDEHAKAIGIPEGHKLARIDLEWLGPNDGEETEVHYYEELNASGELVGRHEVSVITSKSPPPGCRVLICKAGWSTGALT